MTKVDLDELERKARGALDTTSNMGARIAEHVIATTPAVTLALIARIRELEAALGDLVAECEERTENPDGDFYAEPRELLEKGVALP